MAPTTTNGELFTLDTSRTCLWSMATPWTTSSVWPQKSLTAWFSKIGFVLQGQIHGKNFLNQGERILSDQKINATYRLGSSNSLLMIIF